MPHRLPKLLFLALLLFLNLAVASPALLGRDEPDGNSLWELELDDVFGAAAAGLEALYKLWDSSTAPGVTTIPPGVPSEQPDERRYQPPETPGPVGFPLFDSAAMKTCAEAGESQGNQLDIEKSWWQVEQEPETGQPVISACDLPKDDVNDAYIVREIRYVERRLRRRWPAAILISDPVNNVHFLYKVIKIEAPGTFTYQKIPNAKFIRQRQLVNLGYVRRRGWLVGGAGSGQSKEVALKWFENEGMGTTKGLYDSILAVALDHYSAALDRKSVCKSRSIGARDFGFQIDLRLNE